MDVKKIFVLAPTTIATLTPQVAINTAIREGWAWTSDRWIAVLFGENAKEVVIASSHWQQWLDATGGQKVTMW